MLRSYEEELNDLTDRRIKLANKYATARKSYGEHKSELDLLLAGKILKMQEKKKNIGVEMALIMLIGEEGDWAKTAYAAMVKEYNNFKALERMLDAYDNKITAIQSILRFYRENERGDHNASGV